METTRSTDRWYRRLAAVRGRQGPLASKLERLSGRVTGWTGSSLAFVAALAIILAWAVTGPIFCFSDTWQLAINTGTTIVTFLMVFVIQTSQNRDAKAIHLKLDELIHATPRARDALISEEHETEAKMREDEANARRQADRARESAERAERAETAKRRSGGRRRRADRSADESAG